MRDAIAVLILIAAIALGSSVSSSIMDVAYANRLEDQFKIRLAVMNDSLETMRRALVVERQRSAVLEAAIGGDAPYGGLQKLTCPAFASAKCETSKAEVMQFKTITKTRVVPAKCPPQPELPWLCKLIMD